MEGLDFWRLCDDLSVFQAALLISGHDPSGENCHVEQWSIEERPSGYEAAKNALINGLRSKALKGYLSYIPFTDDNGYPMGDSDDVDINSSMVNVATLKIFLEQKGFQGGFFFPNYADDPNYLNSEHDCYAPKLAAAVTAWEIVTNDKSKQKGKTPKQALEKWLREHANEYSLTDENGNPKAASIDQIAKVANWKPEGGAAKTPNLKEVSSNVSPLKNIQSIQSGISDLDDDIPF
ncbi:MAG: hypothetical protein DHS20C08_13620 [Rhodomicrobium sp.]|nr:MAG: hypothetical protein DHS20C08_13620 [Rhodomicrobium sp.]